MAEPNPIGPFSPGAVLIRRADRESGDQKLRPCVVISSEQRGTSPSADTVIVVPLTSETDGRQRLPMPLLMPSPSNGLERPSAAMCGRVTTVRKVRLDMQLGSVNDPELRRIRLGVAAVIGLTDLLVTTARP